jgi:hypothetical protein
LVSPLSLATFSSSGAGSQRTSWRNLASASSCSCFFGASSSS